MAFAESVIHESGRFVGGTNEVPAAELTGRSLVRFRCVRHKTLVLADLTGAALKSLGLNNDISASSDYTASQAWARAIHDASPRWDGIRYVSRQMNKGFAYAIFERSGLVKRSGQTSFMRGKSTRFATGSMSLRCDDRGASNLTGGEPVTASHCSLDSYWLRPAIGGPSTASGSATRPA